MQVSRALNPRRVARSLVTVLVLTLISTIAPPTLFPELLSTSKANPDGLNAYYRSDATGGNDVDLSSPFVTNTCLTTKLQTLTADWGTGGPTGGTSNCGTDDFTAYYTGFILGPKTGTVNFSGVADDVLIVRINGVSVVEKYLNSGTVSGSFNFTEGVAYPIQIWFHEVGGGAAFALNWDAFGSSVVVGSSYLASTAANLLTSQYQTGTCRIGFSAECPAYSPQEIYNLYGTTDDGNYWIMTGGSPSFQYVLMNRSIDTGGWILGMKATKTSTNYDWDDTYRWTTHSIDNASPLEDMTNVPARISGTGTGTDGKYEAFNTVYAQKIRAIFPEYAASTYGGRYTTNNNYGFMWEENLSSLTAGPALSSTYPVATYPLAASANCTGITTRILQDLFANSKRCLFRTPAASRTAGNDNTASYDPIGANLFASQSWFAWWGINYTQPVSGGSPSAFHHSRFGFGWNENSPNTDEGSNDVTAGIGLVKAASGANSWPTGSYVGCCASQAGQNKQMAFELYLRQSDPSLGAPTNLVATTTSSTSVRLSWTAPASTSPVEYVVQYKTNSAAWDSNVSTVRILDPGTNPTASITGLVAGTIYNYRVFARTIDMSTRLYDTNSSATPAYVRSGIEDQSIDSAFNFGGNQFFASSSEGQFDLSSGTTFTLEAWVRPTTTSGSRIIAGKNGQYSLYMSNGSFGFNLMTTDVPSGVGGDSTYFGSSSVKANEWQHVAFTRSGTSFKFYYNGYLVNSSTLTPANSIKDGSAAFTVGGYSTTDQPFSGQIDQVRLWSSERSLSEINDGLHRFIPTNTTGLVAAYGFNEGSGSLLNNLTYAGTSTTDLSLTGGTQNWVPVATTTTVAPYTYVTFPRSILNAIGGWKTPDSITAVTAVVVGGGGGGNAQTDNTGWMAGGGGAGAYQYFTSSVNGGKVETVTVGLGGRRGANIWFQNANTETPTNGQDSRFLSRVSIGGGAGGGASLGAGGAAGRAGGSGGGGGTYSGAGGSSVSGQGNDGGSGAANCCASGGGGGAGGAGGNGVSAGNSSGTGGAAGNGVLNPLFISGTSAQYIAGGGAGGGLTTAGSAGTLGGTAFGANAVANSGSGGGGGGGGASPSVAGMGGSGVIILRYITAIKPSFTPPTNAYLNLGMTETFTTNVAQDSATVGLTRTFRWESSTSGSNGTFSVIKQGTGANNAFFSWVPPDTATSGSNFVYRVIVTDSDTAGLFIQDTSTPVFAVINPALRVVSKSTITKTVGLSKMETFTVSLGTPTYRYSLSPDHAFFWIDTATSTTPRIRIADTATVGTYFETFTVTDSVSASISIPLTIVISPPPSFSASSPQVDSGTVLYLDAGNSASYAGSGATWDDISGRGLSADLAWSSGTTAINANGVTRTATSALNNITCVSPAFDRDVNGSLIFNGSSTCGYVRGIGHQPTYTYELWIKRNGGQTNNAGVVANPNRLSGDQMNWILSFNSNNQIIAGIYNGTTFFNTAPVYIPNLEWTHVAVSYDASTLALYVNGLLSASVSASVTWNPAIIDYGLLIGRKYNDNQTYDGALASLRFYSRPLTVDEIQQNYNATRNRFTGFVNENLIAKKYASRFVDTYTVTAGSESITATFTNNALAGVRWDTSTARSIVLTLQDTLTPGVYYDTITATDIYGSSSRLPITFNISRADTLTVFIDTPTALSYTGNRAIFTPTLRVNGLVGLESGTATSATVRFKPNGATCATGGYCRVGDIGPGGGLVFIDTSTARGDGRIWEVAPSNWSGSDDLITASQYCSNNNSTIGATLLAVGGGETNTNLAKASCLGGAVGRVNTFNQSNSTGYSDWFIPNANEASELIKVADQAGLVFTGANWSGGSWGYWTSTESTTTTMISIGGPGNGSSVWNVSALVNKSESSRNFVRPVRAFRSCWAIDTCTALLSSDTPTVGGTYQIVPSTLTLGAGSINNYVAINYLPTDLTINRVAPPAINIPWINTNYPDTFTVNFPITSTSGNFRLTTTNGTATGCALDYRKIYTTSQGTCSITITRAATRNFTADTATATIFFLTFVNSMPTGQVGSGSTIALNGATSLETSTVTPPSITSLSTTSISLSGGGTLIITGTGFSGSITVKFWRNKTLSKTSGDTVTISVSASELQSIGATSGRISVITAAGQAVSVDSLTITP